MEKEGDGNCAARLTIERSKQAFIKVCDDALKDVVSSPMPQVRKEKSRLGAERLFLYGRPYPLTVVTMDCERRVYRDGAILVLGDTIESVGDFENVKPGDDEASGLIKHVNLGVKGPKVVMPSLINLHVHSAQQLGRGIADDVDLLTWLHDRIWPYESTMTKQDHFWSAMLCCLELLKSGVLCFAEAGGPWPEAQAKVIELFGLRCCLARSSMDCGIGLPENWKESTEECLEKQIRIYDHYHDKADGRIKCWFGLRQILNNSDELVRRTRQEAEKRGVGTHMHVSEITYENTFVKKNRMKIDSLVKAQGPDTTHPSDACRGGTVRHLENLGCLYPGLLAAHSVWVDDEEVKMLAGNDVKICHCPAAAMKMLGFCPVEKLLNAGCSVGLGTDGAPSNNRMNMFDEMYLASLINKGRHAIYTDSTKPEALPAETVIEMATINGAKGVLQDHAIGSLEEGKKADLIVLNLMSVDVMPLHDDIASLVSSCRSENVESAMCNGVWLMFERQTHVDEVYILENASKQAKDLLIRANIKLPSRFKCMPISSPLEP